MGTAMVSEGIKRHFSLNNVILFFSAVLLSWLMYYFYTGAGGPQELASRLIPIAIILQILFMYREGYLYTWLPQRVNDLLVVAYIAIALYAFWHFWWEFEEIAIYRQGSYTREDFICGLLMFLLVMELSRLAHPALFWINLILVFYTLYGYLSPLDFFWHPGTSFYRIVTSSTVEMSTGIYGIYGQIALTVIAAFLLLAAAARGFGAQSAMINVMRRLAGRSRQMVPQTAVLGSLAVGTISGSGSANAVVVGSITIPLMKRYGVPGAFAAAVETAASMGGLLMPPLMGIGAFLMSEFLGVPYWDVVARGFALAAVYYVSLALAVYLLCVRLLPRDEIVPPPVVTYDQVKTSIFFVSVLFLIFLMGYAGIGELLAALYTAGFMFVSLMVNFLYFKHVLKDPEVAKETLIGNIKLSIETHGDMTSYLTLLLATLGIMIGLFTVTGFINRMGATLLDLGSWNIHRHDRDGLYFRLAGRCRTAADGDLYHRRRHHRAAAGRSRRQPVGCAFLRVPDFGLGRAIATDIADRRDIRQDRGSIVYENDVGGVENLPPDHADDVCDLHPLEHGDHDRLAAIHRYDPGHDRDLRFRVRDVRPLLLDRTTDIGLRLITAALSLFVLFYPSDNWAMAVAPFAAIVDRHRHLAAPFDRASGDAGLPRPRLRIPVRTCPRW